MNKVQDIRLAFFSIALNHHQVHIADEMWRRMNHSYVFVELKSSAGEEKGDDSNYSTRPYLLQAWKDSANYNKAMCIAKSAHVCVFSSYESLAFQIARLNKGLISFEMSERWLKKGVLSFLSPRLLINQMNYHLRRWKNKPLYKLCCSAYAAQDQYLMRSFIDKCYKWGYYTRHQDIDVDQCIRNKSNDCFTMMWCARFVEFKHPEIPIKLAHIMKQNNLKFHIDMYGDGPLQSSIESLVYRLGLSDVISFKGFVNNDLINYAMQEHHAFLFTSDRREGWGVVANEAMNNGCLLVASQAIGSIPYLIHDMKTGVIFKDKDVSDLYHKISCLMQNRFLVENIIRNAYSYINEVWSCCNAAECFLQLSAALEEGRDLQISDGPCSKSIPIKVSYE